MPEFVTRDQLRRSNPVPAPVDDGQAAHLPGAALPAVGLRSTNNDTVRLDLVKGRSVIVIYVRAKLPGQTALYDHWDTIPGSTGCSIEACGFRDNYLDFMRAGVRIFGISTEDTARQREAVKRLNLQFPLLSDANFDLGMPLRLPMFEVNEHTFLKRLTCITNNGVIEHVFYPVFPPELHAEQVLKWLQANKST